MTLFLSLIGYNYLVSEYQAFKLPLLSHYYQCQILGTDVANKISIIQRNVCPKVGLLSSMIGLGLDDDDS